MLRSGEEVRPLVAGIGAHKDILPSQWRQISGSRDREQDARRQSGVEVRPLVWGRAYRRDARRQTPALCERAVGGLGGVSNWGDARRQTPDARAVWRCGRWFGRGPIAETPDARRQPCVRGRSVVWGACRIGETPDARRQTPDRRRGGKGSGFRTQTRASSGIFRRRRMVKQNAPSSRSGVWRLASVLDPGGQTHHSPGSGVWRLSSIPAGKPIIPPGCQFGVWRLASGVCSDPAGKPISLRLTCRFGELFRLTCLPGAHAVRPLRKERWPIAIESGKVLSERDAHPDQRHGFVLPGGAFVETA